MKCSGENLILRGIFHVVSGFPLHFMLYLGNFDYFSNSAEAVRHVCQITQANTIASTPSVTGIVFMRRFNIFVGQCAIDRERERKRVQTIAMTTFYLGIFRDF